MTSWANMHGGFIVGDILLGCFACGAIIEYRQDRRKLGHIMVWTSVGVISSLLNPGGGLAFYSVAKFYNTQLMTSVMEYQSTFTGFSAGEHSVAILWLLIVLYFAGLWFARRLYLPEITVALFLAWFSVMYLRNVELFSVAMLPVIGFYFQ